MNCKYLKQKHGYDSAYIYCVHDENDDINGDDDDDDDDIDDDEKCAPI